MDGITSKHGAMVLNKVAFKGCSKRNNLLNKQYNFVSNPYKKSENVVEGKNYVYTWFKEDLTAVDDNFRGIDEITEAEETEETEKDIIVSDAEKAEFIYNDASEAKGRIHKPTYTTSGSGYYFCKVEEVLVVDGREYYGEPAYTRIYKILTLAQ